MKEKKLRELYILKRTSLEKFGECIKNFILEKLKNNGYNIEEILKIQPKVRVKNTDSFIEKALYRGKNYQDPIREITDQVGVRFVVLLESQIKIIKDIFDSSNFFVYSDRDYLEQRDINPTLFDYESLHLVVEPNCELEAFECNNNKQVKCEVQIRTLLQHAYAELTHDLLYKPKFCVPEKAVFRKTSRCMALLESTSIAFEETNEDVKNSNRLYCDVNSKTKTIADKLGIDTNYNKKMSLLLFSNIKKVIDKAYIEYLEKFENDKKNKEMIKVFFSTKADNLLLSQPIIVLILLSINDFEKSYKDTWDLNISDLNKILTYKGIPTV